MGIFDFLKRKIAGTKEQIYGFASKEAESGQGLDQDQLKHLQVII